MLAYFAEAELDALLATVPLQRFTRRTLVTRSAVRSELVRVHERGYALDNEEIGEGLRCLGVLIWDYRVVAAMSVAGPVFRMTNERLPRLPRAVVDVARELSADLGYTDQKRTVDATGLAIR